MTGLRRNLKIPAAIALALAGTVRFFVSPAQALPTATDAGTAAGDPAAANEIVHGPSWGLHGMVVFGGRDGLYASHLPMFHPPHDAQVVLRIRIDDAAVDAAMRATLAADPALWTLVPERFELDRLAPDSTDPLSGFSADLVSGHFERGGSVRYHQVPVVIEQVLIHRPLSAQARSTAEVHYQLIGSGGERFLIKLIDARPDFDHIVALHAAMDDAGSERIVVPRDGLQQPSEANLAMALADACMGRHQVRATIYFDTEDLR